MNPTPFPTIEIKVATRYIEEQSAPEQQRFVFAYHITIANKGPGLAQLIARHWFICDGNGQIDEVRGLGVVGEQPLLQPGQAHDYTSGCVLETPVGTMRGIYRMVTEEGDMFDVPIPEFALALPRMLH